MRSTILPDEVEKITDKLWHKFSMNSGNKFSVEQLALITLDVQSVSLIVAAG